MMLSTASAARNHLKCATGSGNSVSPKRMKPYAPSLLTMPAKNTSTAGGHDSYRSGSQVWNGTMGILMANAAAKQRNTSCSGENVVMLNGRSTEIASGDGPPVS